MALAIHARWLPVSLIVVAGLAGCGKTEATPTPTFGITKGEVILHSYGDRSYALRYDFDCRAECGRDAIEIVEITDGKSFSPISFRGTPVVHSSLMLAGTFLNDGDTSRLDELKHRIKVGPLQTDFPDTNEALLIEYTDLNGKNVRYVVRLVEES